MTTPKKDKPKPKKTFDPSLVRKEASSDNKRVGRTAQTGTTSTKKDDISYQLIHGIQG